MAKKMHSDMHDWPTSQLAKVSQLSEAEVRQSAQEICHLVDVAHCKKVFEPVFKKYMNSKYNSVAQIPVKIRENAIARAKIED